MKTEVSPISESKEREGSHKTLEKIRKDHQGHCEELGQHIRGQKLRIMRLLLNHPNAKFTILQIGNKTGIKNSSSLNTRLLELKLAGLVKKEDISPALNVGRSRVTYRTNVSAVLDFLARINAGGFIDKKR